MANNKPANNNPNNKPINNNPNNKPINNNLNNKPVNNNLNNKPINNRQNNMNENVIPRNNINIIEDNSINIARDLGDKYLKKNISRQLLIIFFIIILFLGLITFLFYNTINKIKVLQSETIGLFNDTQKQLPAPDIVTNSTLRETYILYIYIENSFGSDSFSNFNSPKRIISREIGKSEDNFSIKYNPKTNCISVVIGVGMAYVNQFNVNKDEIVIKNEVDIIELCNLPYQKWLQIAVVINNRNVDIYVNKYLRKTQLLKNVPKLNNGAIILGESGNNPNIFVGRLEYVPDILNNNELSALYLKNMYWLKIDRKLRDKIKYEKHLLIHKQPSES